MSRHASYIIASASRASLATQTLLTHPHFHKPSACGMIFPDDKASDNNQNTFRYKLEVHFVQ